jgi:hypothetical protein
MEIYRRSLDHRNKVASSNINIFNPDCGGYNENRRKALIYERRIIYKQIRAELQW